jgi:hypothetical protein
MQCGGDKSAFIPTNANGIKTSSQCTNCLCEESTCIFTLMSTVVDSKVYGHDTTSVGGQLDHEHIVSVAALAFVFLNAILEFHGDSVFATLAEFRQATSIGAVDYAIFQMMCYGPASEQCGLANVSAFTGVAVKSGVYKNNVLVLLEGNVPSNLGHELTTENTQKHEEWSRQHADDTFLTTASGW